MITWIDWGIWIIYFTLILLVLYVYKSTKKEKEKYRFFIPAFLIKVAGGVAFALIYVYYYGFGDTFLYHLGSIELSNLITENPSQYFEVLFEEHGQVYGKNHEVFEKIQFSRTHEEWFMVKLLSPIQLLSFRSYLVTTLFISVISFLGAWKLKEVFREITKNDRIAFAAVFLVPSVVFWTSGIMKDTLTLAALNFIIYWLYQLIRNKKWLNLVYIILGSWIIFKLKSYIIIAFLPSAIYSVYLIFVNRIKSTLIRWSLVPIILSSFLVVIYFGVLSLSSESQKYNADNLKYQVKGFHSWHTDVGGSSYDLGPVELTASGITRKIPAALLVTFFRPFIWEARNPVVLIGALESLLFLFLFLRGLFKNRFRLLKPISDFKFLKGMIPFILIFGFAVGFTSYNFGALARYKAPVMSLFVVILLLVNQLNWLKIPQQDRQDSID